MVDDFSADDSLGVCQFEPVDACWELAEVGLKAGLAEVVHAGIAGGIGEGRVRPGGGTAAVAEEVVDSTLYEVGGRLV